ncbi:hypothetical protein CRI93_05735 [Longimonas halophila]|uniref:Fibronectin type-III domain-containing protein n=1 Tax=Longimonas halophila TaxID=1469170 RepID=A0A2H3P8B3_9BACT|nr:Ig-like domain-containing protein [Longimonas halophila]PEN07945.1 hypothetical protein CRI93_05735 [Longimonas halophila]
MSLLLSAPHRWARCRAAAGVQHGWVRMLCIALGVGLMLGATLGTTPAYAQEEDGDPIFVRADATTGPGNPDIGTSWETAYASLRNALDAAEANAQIWVAEGTYTPTTVPAQRNQAFFIAAQGVSIYGGFTGTESTLDERPTPVDPTATVLSGDIDGNGTLAGNSYHVAVIAAQSTLLNEDPPTRINDLTIRGGNADSGGQSNGVSNSRGGGLACEGTCYAALNNVVIENNRATDEGGGLFMDAGEAPIALQMRSVTVRGNEAGSNGGGVFVRAAAGQNVQLAWGNMAVTGNQATGNGGGIYLNVPAGGLGAAQWANMSIHGNRTGGQGGGIYYDMDGEITFDLANSIAAGNISSDPGAAAEIFRPDGSLGARLSHTLVEDVFSGSEFDSVVGINNTANIGSAPLFNTPVDASTAPTTAGSVRLNWASPAIDRGRTSQIPNEIVGGDPLYTTDLAGAPRTQGPETDMGAYEGGQFPSGAERPTNDRLLVDASAENDRGGETWSNSYRTLQAALQAVGNVRNAGALGAELPVSIWVAEGTYTPDEGPGLEFIPPSALSFIIPSGTRLLGGFSGGETSASQRNPDPATNNTMLSGALGGETNSGTVVQMFPPAPGAATASVQGITIAEGRLTGAGPIPGAEDAGRTPMPYVEETPIPQSRAAGLYIQGGAPRIEGVHLRNNTVASTLDAAAGLYCQDCSATFESVQLENNSAPSSGGLAVVAEGQDTTPTFANVTVVGNSADEFGGGATFQARNGFRLDATLGNITLADNTAGGTGAGLVAVAGGATTRMQLRLANVVATGNGLTQEGTLELPLEAEGAAFVADNGGRLTIDMVQSTWRAQDAAAPLIGITAESPSSLTIANSILAGSSTPVQTSTPDAEAALTINNSLVEGGWSGPGTGILDADPQLTEAHRPQGNAPVIDAGDDSALPADPLDLDGDDDVTELLPVDRTGTTARQLASTVDMGAFEGGATPRALTESATATGPDSTVLNATANPYSTDPIDYTFAVREQGASTTLLTTSANESPLTGTSNTAISAAVDGLDPETAYEYRIEASSGSESVLGAWVNFTTEEAPPPDANDETVETTANTAITTDLLSLVDGLGVGIDTGSFTVAEEPSNGTVEVVESEATYTPNDGFVGTDSFTYTVANVLGIVSVEAQVTINVTADAPTAADDSYSVLAGETRTVAAPGLLGNDERGVPEAVLVNWRTNSSDQPFNDPVPLAGGTLTVSDNGSLVIDGPTEPGTYTATYTIENAADASTATVTITVDGEAPVAANDDYTTSIDETLSVDVPGVLGNDNLGSPEAALTELTVNGTAVTPGESAPLVGGTLTVDADGSLTLDSPTQVGDATFEYTVENAAGASTATATITVSGTAPVASNDSYEMQIGDTFTADAPGVLGNDNLGSPEAALTELTVNGTAVAPGESAPLAGGTLTVDADGSLTLDSPTQVGDATFDYTIENAAGASTATATITVSGTAPVASNDSYEMQVGDTFTAEAPGVLGNDNLGSPEAALTELTVNGTAIAPGESAGFAGGTLTVDADGSLTLDSPTQVGDATFDYTIENAAGASTATATITVSGTAPVASNDSYELQVGDAFTADAPGVLGNDNLGSPEAALTALTVNGTAVAPGESAPFAGGTLTVGADGSLTLDSPTQVGDATFDYTIANAEGQSTATATITVSGTAPVASNDSYEVQIGDTFTAEAPGVLGNDNLGSPEAALTELTVNGTAVAPGESAPLAGGTLTVVADGGVALENPTEVVEASVTYRIANPVGESEAVITFAVDAPPPPEPVEVRLPPTIVGNTSASQALTFTNETSIPWSDVQATIASSDFNVTGIQPDDEIAPGESGTVTVVVAPEDIGVRIGQLDITTEGRPVASFALSFKAIDVEVEPAVPTLNTDANIDVRVSDNFVPEGAQRLEARIAGTSTYQSLSLTETESGRWTATIPAASVTLSGIDLFVALQDEEGAITAPRASETASAQAPLHVQVQSGALTAEGPFVPEQYQMIALPVSLREATLDDVLTDAYGAYDTDAWRFAVWNPAQERYDEFPATDPLERGRAAWLITKTGTPFQVPRSQSLSAGEAYTQTLQPGWNQISTPFGFAVEWSAVERPDSVEPPVAYRTTRAEGPPEYMYNQATLRPWTGYFVFNSSTTPVSITVPPVAASGQDTPAATAGMSVDPEAASYSAQLTSYVQGHALQHTQTFLGFRSSTSSAPRTFAAAPPVGSFVRTTVVHNGTRHAGYYIDTPTEGHAWEVEVAAQTGNALRNDREVRVQMHETGVLPEGFERYVIDLKNERRVAVTGQSFTTTLPAGESARRYRIVVGTPEFAEQESGGIPLQAFETALDANYPNPVRSETTIEYQLAESGPASIEIYNVLGQRVRRLVDREHEAGPHAVQWDGRNDAGQPVASGPYFYRLQTSGISTARQMMVVR